MAPWWSVVAVLAVAAQVAEGAQPSGRRVHNLYRHDNVLTLRQTAGCGLLSETHQITSSDGYVTTVFRAYSRDSRPKMPVILQHGFLGNSDKWFQLGNDSLPCLLAAKQFDVWLTNSRGNTYSKKHVKYATKYDEFWLFSFHEMAVRDVSATVDYILKLTKYAAVSYVGDGMGGTIGFALFSSLPGFNQKVNTAISVSPIAVISTEKDPIVSFVSYVPHFMERHFVHWTRGELPAYTPNKTETETETRTEERPRVPYVDLTMEVFGDILETDSVDSTSYRTAAHVTQLMRNGGNFARFDYKALNQEKYGRDKPPNYDTKQITTRQLILYGLKDNFVAKEDVLSLCSALPAAVGECREIEQPEMRHDDFLSHPSAKTHVYSIIVEELEARRIDSQNAASGGGGRRLG